MNVLTIDEKFDQLIEIIVNSLGNIEKQYIDFQVAGNAEPIQREVQFCAELYHQMRLHNFSDYDITNEPNKKKHPIIEKHCGPVDPDIIIHRMGLMGPEDNLAVIEVKASAGDLTDGIKKDINIITCMTTISNGYHGGIIIVFGTLSQRIKNNLIERIKRLKSNKTRRFFLILQTEAKLASQVIEF